MRSLELRDISLITFVNPKPDQSKDVNNSSDRIVMVIYCVIKFRLHVRRVLRFLPSVKDSCAIASYKVSVCECGTPNSVVNGQV
jgi:hypothetical protein